jgi:hypothetical protein
LQFDVQDKIWKPCKRGIEPSSLRKGQVTCIQTESQTQVRSNEKVSCKNNKEEEKKEVKTKGKGKESSPVHLIQTIYAISNTIAISPIHQFMLMHSQKRDQ